MSEIELKNLLAVLRASFQQIFGDQFDQMLLFGSRARGDARQDSDIDVLVVLHGEFDYLDVIERTSELVSTLSLENDIVISTAFLAQQRFEQGGSPFILNVRREGMLV